jgi:biopolymer transport protein ExbB
MRRLLPVVWLFVALTPVGAQDEPAAAAAVVPAAAPNPAPGGGANIYFHIIRSVGVFWLVLLPVSIWLIALVVLLAMDLRLSAAIPPGFVDQFTEIVNRRDFKGAYALAREDHSALARVLTAGMSRLQYGIDDAREAAANTLEVIKSEREQKNNYTAVIATLGPLLGLVGTVFGMIQSFLVLSEGTTVNAPRLAEGISHALAVTLVGIAISVPAVALNTYFRNRINAVTLDLGNVADDLLTQMFHNSKKAGVSVAQPSSAPTPRGGAEA